MQTVEHKSQILIMSVIMNMFVSAHTLTHTHTIRRGVFAISVFNYYQGLLHRLNWSPIAIATALSVICVNVELWLLFNLSLDFHPIFGRTNFTFEDQKKNTHTHIHWKHIVTAPQISGFALNCSLYPGCAHPGIHADDSDAAQSKRVPGPSDSMRMVFLVL